MVLPTGTGSPQGLEGSGASFETRRTEIRGVESDGGIGIGIEAIVTSIALTSSAIECAAFLTSTLSGHGETTRHCSVTQTGGLKSSCWVLTTGARTESA